MAIDIGRIAYQAYIEKLDANYLNKWENIGQSQQNAWRSAAIAVSQYLHQEKDHLGKDEEE